MAERIGLVRTNKNVWLHGIRMLFAALRLQTTTHSRTFRC